VSDDKVNSFNILLEVTGSNIMNEAAAKISASQELAPAARMRALIGIYKAVP